MRSSRRSALKQIGVAIVVVALVLCAVQVYAASDKPILIGITSDASGQYQYFYNFISTSHSVLLICLCEK